MVIVSSTSSHVKEQHQAEATVVTRELVGQGGCREDGLGAREGPRGGGDECWWRRSPSTTIRSESVTAASHPDALS